MNEIQATMNTQTVYASIREHALSTPDKVAVISVGADETMTYAQLSDEITLVAGGIAARGFKSGDRVGVAIEAPAAHLVAMIGAMAAGCVPFPLPGLSARTAVLNDASPALVIVEGQAKEQGEIALAELRDSGLASSDEFQRSAELDEIVMIYYTSGTSSGVSKGVLQSHRALSSTATYITEIMQINGDIIEFVASPTDNAFWFGRCRVVMRAGGTLVLNTGSLNPLRIVGALEHYGCNAISGDTPIFVMILKFIEERFAQVAPNLRWIKIASQAMAPALKAKIMEYAPNARSVMNYGLTEAMRCCILPFHDHPDKLDTVGRPCPGVSVMIAGNDMDSVPAGVMGEVMVRGDNLASGYLNREEMWHVKNITGWYSTGDVGYLDGDGFLVIRGRMDDAYNVGGKTISPVEVESYLHDYLSKTKFCVSGAKDSDGVMGQVGVLFVDGEWNEDLPWLDLKAQIEGALPRGLTPKCAVIVADMPITDNGKVRRNVLSKNFEAGLYESL